ncbi:hypothetical protein V497_01971 [Pseudogymnoascus sp. VKM F-4516 (FW-969)]|nr:hypothetical protein V490_03364 [Pseudogymnoascus sp. VKM F-3557]KFY63521.1 hypothetical protein V497_01971 [Pseudogymnoascus sp. VKM F-4516 (FW-969)]
MHAFLRCLDVRLTTVQLGHGINYAPDVFISSVLPSHHPLKTAVLNPHNRTAGTKNRILAALVTATTTTESKQNSSSSPSFAPAPRTLPNPRPKLRIPHNTHRPHTGRISHAAHSPGLILTAALGQRCHLAQTNR